jgi:hypothetical protein
VRRERDVRGVGNGQSGRNPGTKLRRPSWVSPANNLRGRLHAHEHEEAHGRVAVAGIAAAGGSAFTGSGLTSTAAASQFVGGTVAQAVTGATLNDVAYGFTDATNTSINSVLLTFEADAVGKSVAIALSGNGASTSTCADVHGVDTAGVISGPYTSECSVTSYTGADGIAITVS